MPPNKNSKQASNAKFQTSTCGPGLVKVTTTSNTTPNSTPVKRAALGPLGGNDIKGLTRLKVKSAPGTKSSIVGDSKGLSEIRATQDETEMEMRRRMETSVRREVDKLGKKLRKELNMGLSGASQSLASLSAEVARIQVDRHLDGRHVVLLGAYCYINAMITGQPSGTPDEGSSHVEKLVKLATNKTGLIKTNPKVADILSVESAKRITTIIDVQRRHYEAHPNLVPAVLIKKLFLIERAMRSAYHQDLGVMVELLEVVLVVTPLKDKKEFIDTWKNEEIDGWDCFDQMQIDRFLRSD